MKNNERKEIMNEEMNEVNGGVVLKLPRLKKVMGDKETAKPKQKPAGARIKA